MIIYLPRKEPGTTMNKYGLQIRDRWTRTAPSSLAAIEDQQSFFSELGDQVLTTVNELVPKLAGPDPVDEPYLQKVGRLRAATKAAEELAMADVPWPTTELSPDEQRAEWEAQQPSEDSLAEWAWELQGERPFQDQLEALSQQWMLPIEFLEELAKSSNPWTYLAERSEILRQSQEARFQRDLTL
ncbi:hypothetical protein PYV02_14700 [Leifsonia sp. H3M29-4]|uniref:hypothetical protein n=1 Tax=Salinibacterium metalliresistens TaxID=3031321 RepID=UPI0023D9CE0C|nr:hypothetical protein [Salinibacterium metalliresistens]MDF1480332.1 hypothetical protein [Salinibacterium metalliresistens]